MQRGLARIFSERTIAVFLVLTFAGGLWLFMLVQSAVTSFREDAIRRAMTWMGNSITYLCSKSFDQLMKTGASEDEVQTLLVQVEVLEMIEDFTRNNSFGVGVIEDGPQGKRLLLSTFVKESNTVIMQRSFPPQHLIDFSLPSGRYTGYMVPFKQWNWNVVLLRKTILFDNLLQRLQTFYLLFGCLAVLLFLAILFFLYYSRQSSLLLWRSRSRLKSTLDSLVEGVIVTDRFGYLQQLNPAASDITGLDTEQDNTGHHLAEILPLVPVGEESPLSKSAFVEGGYLFTDGVSGEYWLQKSGGERLLLQVRIARPLDPSSGSRDPGLVISFNDISAHRKIEDQLQRAQKMEVIGLMAGGVAHDLNNILSGIVSYPELILLKLPQDSSLRKTVEAIQQSGKRAAAVVEDMLTVARGAASAREIVEPSTVIEQYGSSPECIALQECYPDISLEFSVNVDVANISCSPVHVKKCLHNLLLNGFEAIGEKGRCHVGVRMSMVGRQQAMELQISSGHFIIFRVTDTGPGISPEHLTNIFEPFYTRKKMGRSGTGLGLAVVWNTMQDHRGTVVVRSGKTGTQFELYFPATAEHVGETRQIESIDQLAGSGETILVVDDDPLQRAIATDFLLELQYQVVAAESGERAVEIAKNKEYQLVLLDMIMDPGMSGRETFELLRQLHPNQKALIISGYSDSEDVRVTLDAGAAGFILKPYALADLGRAIRETLRE